MKAARDAFGPIHILFNNAAAGVMDINKSFWDTDDEIWDVALGVNVLAPFHLAKLVFPDMEQHGKGAIINVESCGGFTPMMPNVAYTTAKAALMFLTRSLAKACAPKARVNALCVGSMSPDGQELDGGRGGGCGDPAGLRCVELHHRQLCVCRGRPGGHPGLNRPWLTRGYGRRRR